MFQGQSGYLDHALASTSLAAQVSGVTEWHVNADEPIALDYNVEFKTPNQVNTFYADDAFRSSDHDPVLVGVDLNASPTVDAGGPYEVVEGESVTVTATGDDPDGDPLTYAWDLDDDGTFETPGQSATFSAAAITAPASLTIRVRATDGGGLAATDDAVVNVVDTLRGRIRDVRDALAATDGGNHVRKAVDHLDKALEDRNWLTENAADEKHGKKVFEEVEKALKELAKAGGFGAESDELIDVLRTLAADAIDAAEAAGGDANDIEKAHEHFDKAEEHVADGELAKAADDFGKAWSDALKAVA